MKIFGESLNRGEHLQGLEAQAVWKAKIIG